MIFKWSLQVVAEALAATVVIVLSLGLPPLLGFPSWSRPLFFLPAAFYIKWRLKDRRSIRPLIWFLIWLCPVLFITEFLPMHLVPTAMVVGSCFIAYIIPYDKQNPQMTSPTQPAPPNALKTKSNL